VIEQVDINTLKVVLRFLLKVKVSYRLVFPEQPSIEACAKVGRLGDTFGGLYRCIAPDYF
jgi:hypothetical protein